MHQKPVTKLTTKLTTKLCSKKRHVDPALLRFREKARWSARSSRR